MLRTGAIPAGSLAWDVLIHHCPGGVCHVHVLQSSTGSTGSFTVPDHGDDSYFELVLTATDSAGQSNSTSVSITPLTVQLTLGSTPSGLQVIIGGQTVTTPYTRNAVIGSAHTLNAPSPQGAYSFTSWSDGGAQQHDIIVGAANVTYTAAFSDPTPPVITAVQATTITQSSATITWTTDEPADTLVEYGLSTSYGNSTTLNATLSTAHSQPLSGLAANTTYHYRVKSKDASGNPATSADFTFTTTDLTAPVITAVQATAITQNSATITWTTNEPADTQVEYGLSTSYGSTTTLNATLSTAHSQPLSGLAGGTTYHYRVKSKDASGNPAASADFTFTTTDLIAPVITAVQATAITQNSATITWTTNEPADTQVEYGLSTSYGSTTTLNATLSTAHSQPLSGLVAGTTYHYRVKSKDASGNPATSADFTFTTASTPVAVTKYLSDLNWTSAVNGWGPVEKDTSNGEKAAGDGKTITLNTVAYAKGLGVHAASDVRYNLAGACSNFTARIGVDDEVGTLGSVVFQVWLDGVKAYDSGTMTGTTATKAVSVTTTGKNQLQLVVTVATGGDAYDHADWADAKITCTN